MTREEELRKARERMQKRYEDRNSSGSSSRPNIIDFDKIGGYKKELMYKPKEGINNIDILPYKVKTKNHPDVHSGKMSIGDIDYVLPVWIHKEVGARKGTYVCLEKMYGLPCAICDERNERYKDPNEDKKELVKMYPQQRVIYNVFDLDAQGEPTVQILEMAYKTFEKPLREEAGIKGEVIMFYDHELGKTVQFRTVKDSFPGANNQVVNFLKPTRFDFVDRQKPYQANITDYTFPLDELLVVLTPEELHKIHYGQDQIEDELTETQQSTPAVQKPDSTTQKAAAPASNNPFVGRSKPVTIPVTPISTPMEQPIRTDRQRQRVPNKTEMQCPFNHEWGKDNGGHTECNTCEDATWKACCAEYDRLGG